MVRRDEYKQHALFTYLKGYSDEMQDYIEERKREQAIKQQELKELSKEAGSDKDK